MLAMDLGSGEGEGEGEGGRGVEVAGMSTAAHEFGIKAVLQLHAVDYYVSY